ncbi:MAG: hypothetical protein ACRCYU_11185, partial [Nocardioides sp.]
MSSYCVDGERQVMFATGIVAEVPEWEEGKDGKRRPTKDQARDEGEGGTGWPLWGVEVLYTSTSWGRTS